MARAVLLGLGSTRRKTTRPRRRGRSGLRAGCPAAATHSDGSDGVEFVDDSLSTNVLPAQAALAGFRRPAGGAVGRRPRPGPRLRPPRPDRGRHATAPTLVVTLPDNGPRIGAAIAECTDANTTVVDAADLDSAVRAAFEWAPRGRSCCSHRRPRASAATPTTGIVPRRSPRPVTRCGTLSAEAQQGAPGRGQRPHAR